MYNWLKLAEQGKYDDVVFHRLIPGFMVGPSDKGQPKVEANSQRSHQIQGGDPTGTGRGGASYWGSNFRDEYDMKGAYKHSEKGVLVREVSRCQIRRHRVLILYLPQSMANRGPNTNG